MSAPVCTHVQLSCDPSAAEDHLLRLYPPLPPAAEEQVANRFGTSTPGTNASSEFPPTSGGSSPAALLSAPQQHAPEQGKEQDVNKPRTGLPATDTPPDPLPAVPVSPPPPAAETSKTALPGPELNPIRRYSTFGPLSP